VLSGQAPQLAAWLSVAIVAVDSLPFLLRSVPQIALALSAVAVLGLVVKAVRDRHGILPLAWLGMLGFSLAALLFWPEGGAMALLFGAAGLTMIVSLMQLSYRLAFYDELTGIPGRRALYETMGRLGGRYTIAMSDIDFFKKFNDTHGHDVGDQVLKLVALKLQTVRGGGKVFRYGGEEFTILFDGKEAIEAQPFLEEVRRTVQAASFTKRAPDRPKAKPEKPKKKSGGQKLKVTISLGAASRSDQNPNPEAVMKAADNALYKAKEAGRNCVMVG
jgi:diguanylate cyclase (GGDEF)-like protein